MRKALLDFYQSSQLRSSGSLLALSRSVDWAMLSTTALCFVWVVLGLVGHEPWKPDEGYTFGLVQSIYQTSDWVVPMLAGDPFMEKPPLFFVVAAGFVHLFGGWLPDHDAARLATGFFLAMSLICLALAERELKNEDARLISPLVFIGCIGLFETSHRLQTDMALLAGLACALYGFALSHRRTIVGALLLGTGAGVAFMSKGLIGPGLVGLTAMLLLFTGYWSKPAAVQVIAWSAIAAAPWVLVWPTLLYLRSPQLFIDWFWTNNIGRLTGHAHLGPPHTPWFYTLTLPWFAFPALPMAVRAFWMQSLSGHKLGEPRFALPAAFLSSCLLVLGLAGDARNIYALPILLPLSLYGSFASPIDPTRRGAQLLKLLIRTFFASVAAMLWLGWFALVTGWPPVMTAMLNRYRPGYVENLDWDTIALAATLTLAWLVIEFAPSVTRSLLWRWSVGATLVWGLCATLWISYLDFGKGYRDVLETMRPFVRTADCISSKGLGEPQRALVKYYTGALTHRLDNGDTHTCGLMLIQSDPHAPDIPTGEWIQVWQGHRPGDADEVFKLYRRE